MSSASRFRAGDNGMQPGVSCDSSELSSIGKIDYFRENRLEARQIKLLRLTAVIVARYYFEILDERTRFFQFRK